MWPYLVFKRYALPFLICNTFFDMCVKPSNRFYITAKIIAPPSGSSLIHNTGAITLQRLCKAGGSNK